MPRFHASFGEPSEITPSYVERDREHYNSSISKESLKLINRIDTIEIDIAKKEVFVMDDFRIYILYECAFTDM